MPKDALIGLFVAICPFQREAGEITKTPDEVLSLVRPADDPQLPWTGLLLGVYPCWGFTSGQTINSWYSVYCQPRT